MLRKWDQNRKNKNLIIAVCKRDEQTVNKLLDDKADENCLKEMLDHCEDINLVNFILGCAIKSQRINFDFIEMLLKKGANSSYFFRSVIYLAWMNKDLTLPNLFLSYGASIRSFSEFFDLIWYNHFDIVGENINQNKLLNFVISCNALLAQSEKYPERSRSNLHIQEIETEVKRYLEEVKLPVLEYRKKMDHALNEASDKDKPIPFVISGLVSDYIGFFSVPKNIGSQVDASSQNKRELSKC